MKELNFRQSTEQRSVPRFSGTDKTGESLIAWEGSTTFSFNIWTISLFSGSRALGHTHQGSESIYWVHGEVYSMRWVAVLIFPQWSFFIVFNASSISRNAFRHSSYASQTLILFCQSLSIGSYCFSLLWLSLAEVIETVLTFLDLGWYLLMIVDRYARSRLSWIGYKLMEQRPYA